MRRALLPAAAVAALLAVVAAGLLGWHLGGRPSVPPVREPSPTARIGPAWQYAAPHGPDGRLVEATVLPTSAGVLAVGCLAPSFASAAVSGCADGIDRVRLDGGRVLPPDAGAALRLVLPSKIAALRARRARHRRALARARTGLQQADASRALAAAFGGTADTLSPFADARRQRRLVGALRSTAGAYRRLATAAAGGRSAAYARAQVEVVRGEREAEAALARVWAG